MEDKPSIPTGIEHLAVIRRAGAYVANESATHADEFKISKTRMREFSPANIRRQLETHGHVCANDDWYRELSENYSHPTPMVRPNEHGGSPWVGGKYDRDGAGSCYGRTMYALTMLAMFVCRWFKFDDLFEEISKGLREENA
jgi:hypothetical protein